MSFNMFWSSYVFMTNFREELHSFVRSGKFEGKFVMTDILQYRIFPKDTLVCKCNPRPFDFYKEG